MATLSASNRETDLFTSTPHECHAEPPLKCRKPRNEQGHLAAEPMLAVFDPGNQLRLARRTQAHASPTFAVVLERQKSKGDCADHRRPGRPNPGGDSFRSRLRQIALAAARKSLNTKFASRPIRRSALLGADHPGT